MKVKSELSFTITFPQNILSSKYTLNLISLIYFVDFFIDLVI